MLHFYEIPGKIPAIKPLTMSLSVIPASEKW